MHVDLPCHSHTSIDESVDTVASLPLSGTILQGLQPNESSVLPFASTSNEFDQRLPPELGFIEDQNYNDHSMMTRAKNGVVKPKSFEDFYGFSVVAQQKLYDEYPFFSGFTAISDISDIVEPKSFKSATGKTEWDQAMLEEIDALHK